MKDGELVKQVNTFTSLRWCDHCQTTYVYYHGWENLQRIKFRRKCCVYRRSGSRLKRFLEKPWPLFPSLAKSIDSFATNEPMVDDAQMDIEDYLDYLERTNK